MSVSPERLEDEINDFWFGEIGADGLCDPEKSARWFAKDPEFDRLVARKFASFLPPDRLDAMLTKPRPALAFIILTDQFPRNIHRGRARSFAFDDLALVACEKGIDDGFDRSLSAFERMFFLMPLMHSERMEVQRRSVKKFSVLADDFKSAPKICKLLRSPADFARRHFEIISRFGRFPHRNKTLGRKSTAEEIRFLKQPGSSF